MSGGTDPPDKSSDKYYKCGPKSRVRTLVCVICDSPYHTGHFNEINGARQVSEEGLIICQEHPELDLTSKLHVPLTEEVKILIAQIKTEAYFRVIQEILKEIGEETQEKLNENIHENNEELENIKIEHALLKLQNSELTEKNSILKQ